jgi:IPT/TIG domain-containing protein
MTDGPRGTPGGAEQPAGTPSPRALGAMESAVRRVRASTAPASTTFDAPTPPDPYRPPAPPFRGRDTLAARWAARSDRWLVVAVAVAALAVMVLAIALIVSLNSGGSHVAAFSGSTVPSPRAGGQRPAHHGHSSGAASSTTTSSTLAATPGGPPVIDSITPSSGAAGQTISVTGANFLSSDGHIVATFNGVVASTSCPAQNTCTVTVPPSNGAASAQVIITTAGGASNPVAFTYS